MVWMRCCSWRSVVWEAFVVDGEVDVGGETFLVEQR